MQYLKNNFLRYASKSAKNNNFLLVIFYALAYPFARIFERIGVSPNAVTIISFIFTLLAFGALTAGDLPWFLIFWFIAYLLDFVDGTLARMTGNVRKIALRVDHISDLLKISLIFLGFGIYFGEPSIWVLNFVATTGYLFYTVLSHELNWATKFILMKQVDDKGLGTQTREKHANLGRIKYYIKQNIVLKKIILSGLAVFTTIDGHILLIFFLIPLNQYIASILLTYFILLVSYHSLTRIRSLAQIPKC